MASPDLTFSKDCLLPILLGSTPHSLTVKLAHSSIHHAAAPFNPVYAFSMKPARLSAKVMASAYFLCRVHPFCIQFHIRSVTQCWGKFFSELPNTSFALVVWTSVVLFSNLRNIFTSFSSSSIIFCSAARSGALVHAALLHGEHCFSSDVTEVSEAKNRTPPQSHRNPLDVSHAEAHLSQPHSKPLVVCRSARLSTVDSYSPSSGR
mmetsp:Transcript_13760/g.30478  ORF Transcript_13760/g.30478 Transcript_13760/m.30478 type:complete len:206 (-) Transcript_13760:148-765(-)